MCSKLDSSWWSIESSSRVLGKSGVQCQQGSARHELSQCSGPITYMPGLNSRRERRHRSRQAAAAALSLPYAPLCASEQFWELSLPQHPHLRVPPMASLCPLGHIPALSVWATIVAALPSSIPPAFCADIFLAVSARAEIPHAPQESFWLVTLLLPRLCFGFRSEGHCGPLSAGGLLCPVSCNAVYRAVFPPSLQFRSGSSGCFGPNCQCQAENYGEEIAGTQHLSFVTHPFGETPVKKD